MKMPPVSAVQRPACVDRACRPGRRRGRDRRRAREVGAIRVTAGRERAASDPSNADGSVFARPGYAWVRRVPRRKQGQRCRTERGIDNCLESLRCECSHGM